MRVFLTWPVFDLLKKEGKAGAALRLNLHPLLVLTQAREGLLIGPPFHLLPAVGLVQKETLLFLLHVGGVLGPHAIRRDRCLHLPRVAVPLLAPRVVMRVCLALLYQVPCLFLLHRALRLVLLHRVGPGFTRRLVLRLQPVADRLAVWAPVRLVHRVAGAVASALAWEVAVSPPAVAGAVLDMHRRSLCRPVRSEGRARTGMVGWAPP